MFPCLAYLILASTKMKYTYSEDEESDGSGEFVITPAACKEEVTYHDEDELDDDLAISQPQDMSNDLSDDDMDNGSDASFGAAPPKAKKKPAPKKPAPKKPAAKTANAKKNTKPPKSSRYVELDDDDISDVSVKGTFTFCLNLTGRCWLCKYCQ